MPDTKEKEQSTVSGRTSSSDEQPTGILSHEDTKSRFVEKVARGDFTFSEDLVRGLAIELGVEDELGPAFFGQEEESRTAGLTPATGSGGVPVSPEAASKETVKHAKSDEIAEKAATKPEGVQEREAADARKLREAVGE